jgi:hypothetical protein
MAGIEKGSFDSPDESRTPEKMRLEAVNLGGTTAGRMTVQPGWKWSESIKPIVGTEKCEARHVGTLIAGTLHVVHNDGTEYDLVAGDAYVIEPGHDAWVVGDQPVVGYEFDQKTVETYAKA